MSRQMSEWTSGWKTVASATVGIMFMTGIPSVTGVVIAPLVEEFGWPRALITANVFIAATMSLLLAPLLGRMVVRYGARRCALIAIGAALPGLMMIAMTGGSIWTWIGAWLVFAVIQVGISPMVWMGAVAGLFDRSRGMALAITFSGSGIAFFLFPPLAVFMLSHYGWRGVYFGIMALMLVILLPIVVLWFRDVHSVNLADTGESRSKVVLAGFHLRHAVKMRHFWQFVAVSALMALAEGSLQVHLFPILNEGGLPLAEAAWISGLMGISMIGGRLATGWLFDHTRPIPVFGVSILLILASCLLATVYTGSAFLGAMVSICLGFGAGGTTNALAYLTSRYFGLADYPAIFGLLMGAFSLGYGISPVVAGLLRENTGSYASIYPLLIATLTLAAMLAVTLGKPNDGVIKVHPIAN